MGSSPTTGTNARESANTKGFGGFPLYIKGFGTFEKENFLTKKKEFLRFRKYFYDKNANKMLT